MKQADYSDTPQLPYKIGCGGLVLRKKNNTYEVLCLYRGKEKFGMRGDSYHLPKGTLKLSETLEQCALRETREETGALCQSVCYIGATTSKLSSKDLRYDISYTRHFFLMRLISMHEAHDDEHDEVVWLPVEEAYQKLAEIPKEEDKIVKRAVALVESRIIQL
ncbi:NUDIX hydrolase [Candidatus Saccharibacteria bacterium]|nr:NUDIX hydrolase [Candidatus Saccharibacteria bacterium]